MATIFNNTVTLDKTSYNKGDTMTATLGGTATQTAVSTETDGPFSFTLGAPDGSTETVSAPTVQVSKTTTTNVTAKITGATDPQGRVWTPSADGQTATAIA